MDAILSAAVAALVTAWIARGIHRRALRRKLAEYGRGHARLRELEAELRVAWTRHEVALEAMRRERRALGAPRTSRVGEPMLVLDDDDRVADPPDRPSASVTGHAPRPAVLAAVGTARA